MITVRQHKNHTTSMTNSIPNPSRETVKEVYMQLYVFYIHVYRCISKYVCTCICAYRCVLNIYKNAKICVYIYKRDRITKRSGALNAQADGRDVGCPGLPVDEAQLAKALTCHANTCETPQVSKK